MPVHANAAPKGYKVVKITKKNALKYFGFKKAKRRDEFGDYDGYSFGMYNKLRKKGYYVYDTQDLALKIHQSNRYKWKTDKGKWVKETYSSTQILTNVGEDLVVCGKDNNYKYGKLLSTKVKKAKGKVIFIKPSNIISISGLCLGYFIGWEGGVYSLRGLVTNILEDKVEHCRKHGIMISPDEWPVQGVLPGTMISDRGSEYISENFAQLTELGPRIISLPGFRPDLKGPVEQLINLIQETYEQHLHGYGTLEFDFAERGAKDYRKEACLTLSDFEKIVLMCILDHNAHRIAADFPYTEEMLDVGIRPYANALYEYGKTLPGACLIPCSIQDAIMTLLPRTIGKFTRTGLKVNGMRYKASGFTEEYLRGGSVTCAYNPDDSSVVWLIRDGEYIPFMIVVDEVQNVIGHRNGLGLIGMLTQLINASGVSICMVGVPSILSFFEQEMHLARRSIGLHYEPLKYGNEFVHVCQTFMKYQYVADGIPVDQWERIIPWLYEHSGGVLGIVVALIHDAQEIGILSGEEQVSLTTLNKAFKQRSGLIHGYIHGGKNLPSTSKTMRPRENVADKINQHPETSSDDAAQQLAVTIQAVSARGRTDNADDIVGMLRPYVTVEDVCIS